MKKANGRNKWASKLGFILATAGAAVGLGNLWKFPYLMGKNGGFQFLIAYLIFIVILGLPVMITEMSIGRLTEQSPVNAYHSLNKNVTFIGIMAVLAAFLILSYYSVVGGWILKYISSYITMFKAPIDFSSYIAEPTQPVLWHFIFIVLTCVICYMGTTGIEKASSIMMPALFVILVILVIRSVTLDGAADGLKFMFSPYSSKFNLGSLAAALGQVFYSLSLCMGITITYGSYLSRKENIPKSCLTVAGLDTMVAILAGLAIFPAVFAFKLEPAQGPSLIFGTLPSVFNEIYGGVFFAILFFILVFFAALTSSMALLECVASFTMDNFKWSRKKSISILGTLIFLLGIPSALSFGVLENFKILNYQFFDFMSMITDNILMPLGGIAMCIYVGWFLGPEKIITDIEFNSNVFKLKKAWIFCIKFITPILIGAVTIAGFINIYNVIRL